MEDPKEVEGLGLISPADVLLFRRKLMDWYGVHARVLPWRGVRDPYLTWVSEVMLQQTRVAAVLEHFTRWMQEFPTVQALASAPGDAVLAAWSGLGYYQRVRRMQRAAQFVVADLHGAIPSTSEALRMLPGIGEYTCAAIASIAFGESIAVVDGNVERVLLRVTGRPEDSTAAGRNFVREQASALMPRRHFTAGENATGDHNQAMMELGATLCLPRAPLCLNCPVFDVCRTRGEHRTTPRGKQRIQRVAYLLATKGSPTEVLLERRDAATSLMPGMLELPMLPIDALTIEEPVLRLRHGITNTNYEVEIYSDGALQTIIPARKETLVWGPVDALPSYPLTGLARKVLRRVRLMDGKEPASIVKAAAS